MVFPQYVWNPDLHGTDLYFVFHFISLWTSQCFEYATFVLAQGPKISTYDHFDTLIHDHHVVQNCYYKPGRLYSWRNSKPFILFLFSQNLICRHSSAFMFDSLIASVIGGLVMRAQISHRSE